MTEPVKRLSPMAARALARREERLEEIAEQIDTGHLVVRQMTDAEREKLDQRRASRPQAKTKPKSRARS
jgi:hypothetical protein